MALALTTPQRVWRACGYPAVEGARDLPHVECWLCGGGCLSGVAVSDWMPDTFTAQNKARAPSSPWICSACVYTCSRLSPVPGREAKEGKKLGGNFRNYSHILDGEQYTTASKGEKPAILSFLRRQHAGEWAAAIADSGQKHLLPWTPVNPAGCRRGVVLFEETLVTLPMAAGWTLIDRMAGLLTDGATKEEIASGQYGAGAWQRCPEAIDGFEDLWSGKRGSTWFDLALWLAQRDEAAVKGSRGRVGVVAASRALRRGAGRGGSARARDRDGAGAADVDRAAGGCRSGVCRARDGADVDLLGHAEMGGGEASGLRSRAAGDDGPVPAHPRQSAPAGRREAGEDR